MAETIGRAYVKILADGRGLGRDVEKELRKHEDAFSGAGDRNGKSYSKAFDQAMKDSPTWANMTKRLNESVAHANVAHEFFDGPAWQNVVKDMETIHGPELADKLRTSFEKEFRKKGSLSGLEDALGDTTSRLSHIIEDDMSAAERRVAEAARNAGQRTKRTFRDVERDAHKFSNRFENTFSRTSDVVARLFGKGARNNFFNLIGVMVGGVSKAIGFALTMSFKFFEFLASAFGSVTKKADDAANATAQFGEEMGAAAAEGTAFTLATGGASIVAGLIAISAALLAAAGSAGVFVSAVSLAVGAVVALVGSLAFAAGALAAFLPLLIPVAGIVAGLVIGFMELKNASGPLKTSMDKLKGTAKGLKNVFADAAFKNSGKLFDRINDGLKRTKPLVRAAGDGFRLFIDQIVKGFDSPVFQRFSDQFSKFLPGAMKQMGTIASNVLGGLAGIFTALIPSAHQLLNWLTDITGQFSAWASSKSGRQQIHTFMDEAIKSAQALGNFLGAAWDVLTNLLSSGKGTGDSLITEMGNSLQRVADWLKAHPDDVKRWFADAKAFADQLGSGISDIVDDIDKLDTPAHRVFAVAMVDAIISAINWTVTFINTIGKIASAMLSAAGFVVAAFGKIVEIALGTVGAILSALNKLPFGIGGVSDEMLSNFNKFKDGAVDDINSVGDTIHTLKTLADAGATLNIDTSGASAAVASLSAQVDALLAKARQSPKSPTAVEHGVTQGGQSSSSGGTSSDDSRTPHRTATPSGRTAAGVVINVHTPTKDPVGVANETVNRLIGVGYAT